MKSGTILPDEFGNLFGITACETMSDNPLPAICLDDDVGKQYMFVNRHTAYRALLDANLLAAYYPRFLIYDIVIINYQLVGEHRIPVSRHSACCKLVSHDLSIL